MNTKYKYFNEFDINGGSSGGTGSVQSSQKGAIASAGKAQAASEKSTATQYKNKVNGDFNEKYMAHRRKQYIKVANLMSTYLTSKYQTAEVIMSDYMKIIKAHVT